MAFGPRQCGACGSTTGVQEHHIVPRACGGTDLPSVWLCGECHGAVHGRSFDADWRALQREGIAAAKAAGKYQGRAPTARRQADDVLRLKADGQKPDAIAASLGIGRASVYRILRAAA